MEFIFFCSVFLIIYQAFGYTFIVYLLSSLKKFNRQYNESNEEILGFFPFISIIIPVHNEQEVIMNRLENIKALNYPTNKLEVIIASDNSSDKTVQIVKNFKGLDIKIFESQKRLGKSGVQNTACTMADGQILVFTDADTIFDRNFLVEIKKPFLIDPSVGCVGGTVYFYNKSKNLISKIFGDYYWKMETKTRLYESCLGILTHLSGMAFAVRKECYTPIPEFVGDDYFISFACLFKGHKVVLCPNAIAYDEVIDNSKGQLKQKRRTTNRYLNSILIFRDLINPFKFPMVSWSLISRRLLRYFLPLLIILIIISSYCLIDSIFFLKYIFFIEVLIIILSLSGIVFSRLSYPYKKYLEFFKSLLYANVGIILGLIDFMKNKKTIHYEVD